MSKNIKIYGFRPYAEPIIKTGKSFKYGTEFEMSLEEFLEKEEILFHTTGLDFVSDYHNIAYLVIDKHYIDKIKHALKPQRAFLLED